MLAGLGWGGGNKGKIRKERKKVCGCRWGAETDKQMRDGFLMRTCLSIMYVHTIPTGGGRRRGLVAFFYYLNLY